MTEEEMAEAEAARTATAVPPAAKPVEEPDNLDDPDGMDPELMEKALSALEEHQPKQPRHTNLRLAILAGGASSVPVPYIVTGVLESLAKIPAEFHAQTDPDVHSAGQTGPWFVRVLLHEGLAFLALNPTIKVDVQVKGPAEGNPPVIKSTSLSVELVERPPAREFGVAHARTAQVRIPTTPLIIFSETIEQARLLNANNISDALKSIGLHVVRAPTRDSLKRAETDTRSGKITFVPTLGNGSNWFANFETTAIASWPDFLIIGGRYHRYKVLGEAGQKICHRCKGYLAPPAGLASDKEARLCLAGGGGRCKPQRNPSSRPPKKARVIPSALALGAGDCPYHLAGRCPNASLDAPRCARVHSMPYPNCAFGPATEALLELDPGAKCANGSGCLYVHDGSGVAPASPPKSNLAQRMAAARAARAERAARGVPSSDLEAPSTPVPSKGPTSAAKRAAAGTPGSAEAAKSKWHRHDGASDEE